MQVYLKMYAYDVSQEAPYGLQAESESEFTAQTAEDEQPASNQQESTEDQYDPAESKNDESSHSPPGK